MRTRAAIYCRVSTSRQASEDKTSLGDQEERARSVCESKGWEVVGVYDEADASGGTVHRGEFQRLLADARAGDFDVIVCREVSRLSRVAQARRAIEELMIEWGLAVCNARSGMVYSEDGGLGASVIWTIEAKMAEAELAERSFRTTMGKNGKASKGLMPSGTARYGYRWSGGEDSRLIPDEVNADLVREIFAMVASGEQCPTVARTLNDRGVPSPRGRQAGWRSQTIHKMVSNRAYIGEHEYGLIHYRKLNSEREIAEWSRAYFEKHGAHPTRIPTRVRELRPAGDENRYAVQVPAIVDSALWERANRSISRIKRNRREKPRRVMLLQGLLRCENCGHPMRSTWTFKHNTDKFYFSYRCATHSRDPGRAQCRPAAHKDGRKAQVNADQVEREVWDLVDSMLSVPDTLVAAIGAKVSDMDVGAGGQDRRIARHEARLDESRRAWDKARRVYLGGRMTDADYDRDKDHFEREIASLEDELRRVQSASEERHRHSQQRANVESMSRRWSAISEALTAEERREIIWALVSDVTISQEDQVTVTGTLSAPAPEKSAPMRCWLPSVDSPWPFGG